jgi:hypothetical protein
MILIKYYKFIDNLILNNTAYATYSKKFLLVYLCFEYKKFVQCILHNLCKWQLYSFLAIYGMDQNAKVYMQDRNTTMSNY